MHRSSLSFYHCRNYVLRYSTDPLLSTRISCCGKVAALHLLFFKLGRWLSQAWLDAYDSSMHTIHLSLALDSRTAPIVIRLILLSWPLLQRDHVIPGPNKINDVLSQGFTVYPASCWDGEWVHFIKGTSRHPLISSQNRQSSLCPPLKPASNCIQPHVQGIIP